MVGPRAAPEPLSRDRILQAAFRQADEHGLAGVTMRSVAALLGVEAMSLYHHVPHKKALLDGLFDLLVQVAELPGGEVSVEQWIRGVGDGFRALAQQHPRLVPLFGTRAVPLDDPRSALPFEAGLGAFVREGQDVDAAFASVQAVAVSLLALTQLEATAVLQGDTDDASRLGSLPVAQFPLLHRVHDAEVELDAFWTSLVEALVRGYRAQP